MADFVEIDFLAVETAKSGDAITVRYSINGTTTLHVVDGGFLDTGEKLVEHLKTHYQTTHVDHVVITYIDQDHVWHSPKPVDTFHSAVWRCRSNSWGLS